MRKKWRVVSTQTVGLPFETYLERLKRTQNFPFLIRKGEKGNGEIITFYGKKTVFMKGIKRYQGVFLFNQVKNQFQKFLDNGNEILSFPPRNPSRRVNHRYDFNGKIVETDIKHAYWRIAYINGFINKKLYEQGCKDEYKLSRNTALSTCGTERRYNLVKNGEITEETVVMREESKDLRDIYTYIRLECYRIMYDLSDALKDEWKEYNTDGIKYLDTEKNRKIVVRILKREKMLFAHIKDKKKPSAYGGKGLLLTSKKRVSNESA